MDDICVWRLGTPCKGEVTEELIFGQQLAMPICERHLREHQELMFLNFKGHDIETLVQMEYEDRHKLFEKVKAQYPDEELPQ